MSTTTPDKSGSISNPTSSTPRYYKKGTRENRKGRDSFTRKRPCRRKSGKTSSGGNDSSFMDYEDEFDYPNDITIDTIDNVTPAASFSSCSKEKLKEQTFKCQKCGLFGHLIQLQCLHLLCELCNQLSDSCKVCKTLESAIPQSGYIIYESEKKHLYKGSMVNGAAIREFFILPTDNVNSYSDLKTTQKSFRKSTILEFAIEFSEKNKVLSEQTVFLIEESIKLAKSRLKLSSEIEEQWKIDIETEVTLMHIADISGYARSRMKTYLIEMGADFLNPTNKYVEKVNEINIPSVQLETKYSLEPPAGDAHNFDDVHEDLIKFGLAKVSNTKTVIQDYLTKTEDDIVMDSEFNNELWLKIGVDKGGGSTKVMISFANRPLGTVNSPFNWFILACFTGKDNYEDLKEHCGSIFQELDDINELMLNGKNMKVRKFAVGDIPAQSAMFGLLGPASRYPCVNCTSKLSDIKIFQAAGPPRYQKQCENCLKMNERHTLPGLTEKERKNAEKCDTTLNLSYMNPPLLNFSTTTAAFPSLHVWSGPVTEIFKCLEALTHLIPKQKLIGETVKVDLAETAAKRWRMVQESTQKEKMLRFKALENVKMCIRKEYTSPSATSEMCYRGCIFDEDDEKSKIASFVTCSKCNKKEHNICGGWSLEGDEEDVLCWKCALPTQVAREKADRMEAYAKMVAKESDSRTLIIEGKRSYATWEFKNLSEQHGIRLGAFHGRLLPGNHIDKFLTNHEEFFDLVKSIAPDDGTLGKTLSNLQMLSKSMHQIHQLTSSRFLTDSEVDLVARHCADLNNLFQSNDIRQGTVKLHMLIDDLPFFVEDFRTIGLLCEQGIEHEHVNFEASLYRYRNYKDIGMKFGKALMATNRRNLVMLSHICRLAKNKNDPN